MKDWSLLNGIVCECYWDWYDKHRSKDIGNLFSCMLKGGKFVDALGQTLAASSFYTEVVWKIAVTTALQGLEWTDTVVAIRAWSDDGSALWYAYV